MNDHTLSTELLEFPMTALQLWTQSIQKLDL